MGLPASSSEASLADAIRDGQPMSAVIKVELDRFKCTLTDLYVLVTLFTLAPRRASLQILASETLADSLALRRSLDHLDRIGAIATETSATAEPALATY